METPLLRTKLYIPSPRPELVSRPRLIERLNAGLHRKLTLIAAPAGFGKTTLVGEWVASLRRGTPRSGRRGAVAAPGEREGAATLPLQVAWLSLDESDNDVARFLAYLVAALQQATDPDVGQAAQSALASPQPPPAEAVLSTLINDIAALSDRILLVLDDYHLIDGASPGSAAVHDALTFLLRHLPPPSSPAAGGIHLVISTREDPPLPLARLRARGQLTELRAADLRFTPAEAAAFLNPIMGLDLSAQDIAALDTRTEGWIAGLQLAALALQGTSTQERPDARAFIQSFTGSHRYVLDYLIEEVLEQQPDDVQAFLLQTALLDRLTGPLCDAVTGHAVAGRALTGERSGQETLERLDRANLFVVPLDQERRWYRYHHLFADLLRQRLQQGQPERVPVLHTRAIEWYQQNGFTDEAIEHALRAQAFERAADLIEGVAEAIWGGDQHVKLRPWLARLPMEVLSSRPHLCVFHASYLFASGQQAAAERYLRAAEAAAADGSKLLGRIAATRAFMASYRSDASGVIPYALQALDYLPEQDITWRGAAAIALGDAYVYQGQYAEAEQTYLEALETIRVTSNTYLWMNVSLKLALNLRSQGRLQQVVEICQQRLQLARESGMAETEMAGWLLAIWGEVQAELGDLEGALRRARKGVALTEQGGDVAMLTWSYMCLTRVLFSRGDLAAAHEIITATERIAQASVVPQWVTNLMGAWRVRTWLVQGKLDETLAWMRKRGLDLDAQTTYVGALDNVAVARVLIAQERYGEAVRLLERLLEPAEAGAHTTRVIQILILQALALQAGGHAVQALARLERALTLARPGGFVRIFVDDGPAMERLLYDALGRGIMPDYVGQLLAAFPDGTARPAGKPPISESERSPSPLVEPLSERELEVLALLAEGLTNREIASRLYLALNTVKAHTGNIYGKLSVHNRTQAVARARALGLLPSI